MSSVGERAQCRWERSSGAHEIRALLSTAAVVIGQLDVIVEFTPNDPEASDPLYDTTDLLRRLALINNEMFPAEEGAHPIAAYNSIGRLVKQYDPAKFFSVASLLPDVLQLEELVVRHWEQVRGKGPGKIAITFAAGVTVEPTTLLTGYRTEISESGVLFLWGLNEKKNIGFSEGRFSCRSHAARF